MIRTIGVAIFLIFFFIISIPMYFIEWLTGKKNPEKMAVSSQGIVCWALRSIIAISGIRQTIIGLENVPEDTPVVYIGNHRSYFDIVALYPLMKHRTGFVAKKELAKIPFISRWMRFLNCQFLDRDNIKEGLKTVLTCIDLAKKGSSIVVFPEGTRTPGDEMLPFKEGSLKIADKSGRLVIPVAISNTEAIFENHMPKIKSSHIVIEFGKAIDLKAMDKDTKKHAGALIQQEIAKMLEKNHKYTE